MFLFNAAELLSDVSTFSLSVAKTMGRQRTHSDAFHIDVMVQPGGSYVLMILYDVFSVVNHGSVYIIILYFNTIVICEYYN